MGKQEDFLLFFQVENLWFIRKNRPFPSEIFLKQIRCFSGIKKGISGLKRKNIAEIYYNKAFEATDNMRNKHLFALSVAELYDPEKDFDKPMQYLLQAQQNDESQKCYYYLAVLHFRHGNKEEAKKYYSLAIGCKKFPHIDNANLKQLKKMLFD